MSITINGSTGISGVDGSSTTPAFQGTDTNTGIFFSAADTIDFTEGGTAVGQFDSSANFKFNSGYGSVATAYGCRAWVNFNGTGTVAIRASGNVSSITDRNTGRYTVNLITAMPDTNYSAVVSCSTNNGDNVGESAQAYVSSTTAIPITTGNTSAWQDSPTVCVSVFR